MATIQIRELPEDSYEVLRRRARRAGKSLQAYMRDELVALAKQPSKEEALERVESALALITTPGPDLATIVKDVEAGRR